MTIQAEILYSLLFLSIFIVIFLIGLFKLPRLPRNTYFQMTCLFLLGWLTCDFARMMSDDITLYNFELNLALIFVQLAATSILLFSISFYKLPIMPPLKIQLLFFIVPAITAIFTFVPAFKSLVFDFAHVPATMAQSVSDLGPWFWIQAVYNYLLLLIAVIIVIYGHLSIPKFYRFQSTLVVFAIGLIPIIHVIRFTGFLGLPEFSFALFPLSSI